MFLHTNKEIAPTQEALILFFCLDTKETKNISAFVVIFKGAYEIASLSSRTQAHRSPEASGFVRATRGKSQ